MSSGRPGVAPPRQTRASLRMCRRAVAESSRRRDPRGQVGSARQRRPPAVDRRDAAHLVGGRAQRRLELVQPPLGHRRDRQVRRVRQPRAVGLLETGLQLQHPAASAGPVGPVVRVHAARRRAPSSSRRHREQRADGVADDTQALDVADDVHERRGSRDAHDSASSAKPRAPSACDDRPGCGERAGRLRPEQRRSSPPGSPASASSRSTAGAGGRGRAAAARWRPWARSRTCAGPPRCSSRRRTRKSQAAAPSRPPHARTAGSSRRCRRRHGRRRPPRRTARRPRRPGRARRTGTTGADTTTSATSVPRRGDDADGVGPAGRRVDRHAGRARGRSSAPPCWNAACTVTGRQQPRRRPVPPRRAPDVARRLHREQAATRCRRS